MSQRNLLILLITMAVAYACYVRGEQNPYARYAASGLAAIRDEALHEVPNRELFEEAMRGMVGALGRAGDEHSQFVPETEANPLRDEIRQQFGGIGVRLGFVGEPPRLTIVGPPEPGTPAAKANLLPGDYILAIDDDATTDMTMADVLRNVRGRPGTRIRLDIQHEHQSHPVVVELVREIITIESILGDLRGPDGKWQFRLTADPQIALLRITSFGDQTADELSRALEQITANGVQGAVLDLRDNAGGALDAAVAVCDLLLPAGRTIVETRGRRGILLERYTTTGVGRYRDLPLAVLVNQNSASAAEIVAACLQDHHRAVIVGQRTYGKGTVQQLLPLESGNSLLKLTWASFWRPSGSDIHRQPGANVTGKWGVVPDRGYEVHLPPEEYAAYRKYRNARDMYGVKPPASDDADQDSADAAFVDRQLQLAVESLRESSTK